MTYSMQEAVAIQSHSCIGHIKILEMYSMEMKLFFHWLDLQTTSKSIIHYTNTILTLDDCVLSILYQKSYH